MRTDSSTFMSTSITFGSFEPSKNPDISVYQQAAQANEITDINTFINKHMNAFSEDSNDNYEYYGNMSPLTQRVNFVDEEGVRLPDPVRSRRLVNHSSRSRAGLSSSLLQGRAEDPNIEWIHPPPQNLCFPGNFQEV